MKQSKILDPQDENEDKFMERMSLSPPPYIFTEMDALKYISYQERLQDIMRRKLMPQSIQKLPLEKEFTLNFERE